VIEEALPLVRSLARGLLPRLPAHVDLDDVVQDGCVGLVEAAARFDPAAGVPFAAFARRRILGAMLDGQRASGVRDRRWFTREGGGRKRPGNAENPGVPVGLDGAANLVASDDAGPADLAEAAETARRVRSAVAALPPRERLVIELHHGAGLAFREINLPREPNARGGLRSRTARRGGVGWTRVSQIHQRALQRLRVQLA